MGEYACYTTVIQIITLTYKPMRNIVNISVPAEMAKDIKREVKLGKFASTSEFMRHLIRMWNTEQLMRDIEQSRKEIAAGKGKVLQSLKDLR